jgi:hypothetical protein
VRARSSAARHPDRAPLATIASWPLEIDDSFVGPAELDPWESIVRRAIDDLRFGRLEEAATTWHPDAVWHVRCDPHHRQELAGPEAVLDHHRELAAQTAQTFHQRLLGLVGSAGPIVTAYVRTLARRGRRSLDQPTLITFELAGGRIRSVTEMPGDVPAWCRFWAH